MKKFSSLLVAIVTSLVSLTALCICNLILAWIGYYIAKVPFLADILDFIGEVLDLGLTALIAILIAGGIWNFGHSVVEKLRGEKIDFDKGPVHRTNILFIFVFLAMSVFIGIEFFAIAGDVVSSYTADVQGFTKVLMFLKAAKDAFLYVGNTNYICYTIGESSLILFIINIFFTGSL